MFRAEQNAGFATTVHTVPAAVGMSVWLWHGAGAREIDRGMTVCVLKLLACSLYVSAFKATACNISVCPGCEAR